MKSIVKYHQVSSAIAERVHNINFCTLDNGIKKKQRVEKVFNY